MKKDYHAIVVDKKDIGEMDRVYTFYTRENGLLRTIARSVRKVDAKMASQVEDFTVVHVSIARSNGVGMLVGAVAEKYFTQIRQNFNALLCVDRARRIFLSLTPEHDADENIFDLFVNYLMEINELAHNPHIDRKNEQMEWITQSFLIQFYELSGYVFDTHVCCICHKKVACTRNGFSAYKGGLICDQCSIGHHVCIAGPDTIKALRIIHTNQLHALRKVVVHKDVHHQLGRITNEIAQWIMR